MRDDPINLTLLVLCGILAVMALIVAVTAPKEEQKL